MNSTKLINHNFFVVLDRCLLFDSAHIISQEKRAVLLRRRPRNHMQSWALEAMKRCDEALNASSLQF
jgi:hypothetical protein